MSTVAGFPYAKLDAAKLLLYSYKPWWRNFGDRIEFVPIDTPVYDDSPYTGSIKATQDMKLLVDKSFVMHSTVSVIAGKVEYELQKYIISYWDRLNQVDEKDRERVRQACLGMEVTSSMVSDSMFLKSPSNVPGLPGSLIRKWNITEPPSIPDNVWNPASFGMPMGLSAESYYERTKGYFEMPSDPQNGDGQGDTNDNDGEARRQDKDNESAQSSNSGSTQEDETAQDTETDDSPDAPFDEYSADDSEDDVQDDTSDSDQNDDAQNNQSENDSESDEQPNDASDDSSSENAESDSDDFEGLDSTREREGASNRSDGANMDDLGPSSEQDDEISDDEPEIRQNEQSSSDKRPSDKSFDVDEGYQQSTLSSDTIADKINDECRQDPALDWEAKDDRAIERDAPQDADKQQELQDALDELVEDIEQAKSARGFDVMRPGNSILQFPKSVREARRDKVLRNVGHVLSRAINTQMAKGYNDFSYSVRNPNQPQFGPIMMGTNDYNPMFYWLQDVSMSMHTLISTCYDKLKETTKDLSVKYGDALTWITADTKIEQVGKSYNLPDDPLDTITQGFGATDISAVILELSTGKFRFEGKRYPCPDVLFVTTDCFFDWDSALERLSNKVKIIILCPLELDYVKSFKELPDWIVEGKTFFHVGV